MNTLKINNIPSVDEGWQYINNYANDYCLKKGYDEYGINEFYEDKAYASVVFFINDDVKESVTFDISDLEKFADFKTNKPYRDFVFEKARRFRITDRDIKDLLNKEPNLTSLGIEDGPKRYANELPEVKNVQACIDWLMGKKLIPTKTVAFSSINIKQLVERDMKTYVTSGAAIAAVIYFGIPYKKIKNSPYVNIYLLKKEIFR